MVNAETPIRRMVALTGGSAIVLLCPLGLLAQAPMGTAPHINPTDMAVLETREVRKDLACTVTPNKPELGFDLRFHGGFDVSVPLN
jgi:hypothetical protein